MHVAVRADPERVTGVENRATSPFARDRSTADWEKVATPAYRAYFNYARETRPLTVPAARDFVHAVHGVRECECREPLDVSQMSGSDGVREQIWERGTRNFED